MDPGSKLSISRQCELLDIPRSTYYSRHGLKDRKKEKPEDNRLDLVLSKWAEYNSPGYWKLSRSMLEDGIKWATEHVVRRLCKRLCIHGISPVFRTTRPAKGRKSGHGYLLRGKRIMYVNQVWSTDITYIRVGERMMYFTAVMDLFSRKILSWRLMGSMETRYCIEVVEEAIAEYGVPAIFNSDCGSQYTCEAFEQMLEGYGILISHDGVGRCLDNIYVERTWRTLKYEWIFLKDYRDEDSLRRGLDYFVGFYNTKRLHQSLGYKTPDKVYYEGCFPMGNSNKAA